ncbi:MAG: DUF4476 domain-containing protein [Bacteroidota bacterium]
MKTIFTLLSSLMFSIAVFAADARPKSSLTIQSVDRGTIRVIIDGRRFEPNDNYLRIQSLQSGNHLVKVYRERNTGLFRIFGKMYEVVYSGSLKMKPFSNVLISVDRFGKATVSEFSNRGNGRDFRNMNDGRVWDNKHDFDFDRGQNQGDYDKDRDGRIGNNGRDDRNGQFGGRDDRGYNDNSYSKAMNDLEFSRVLSSIQKEWIENNKVKSAMQIISTNYFTTIQVKQMLQLLNSENNKLDLAKQAFDKTVDQRNYTMINDVFSFNSSKEELARFIRNH